MIAGAVTADDPATTRVIACDAEPKTLAACTVNEYDPVAVGMPLIVPEDVIPIPGGKAPSVMLQVMGFVPVA